MSQGFQNAGFEIQAAFDNWKPALKVYSDNFTHPIFDLDLSTQESIRKISKYSPEIIIGGPPCQDFSIAGYNNKNSKRANLTVNFAQIVTTVMPQWFVMENVYNIEKNPVLRKVMKMYKGVGYGLTQYVLNASYVGVPQARKRYFLIGHLDSHNDFLIPNIEENLSANQMTVSEYFNGNLDTEYYYAHPRSYARRAVFSIHEPSATIRGTNRPIPPTYKRHPADKANISDGVRPLTTKERSYIQTFPQEFKLEGTKAQLEQVIGNAVPVKMAEYIATCIKDYREQVTTQ
jgi:DNA (cytosine-5)-methyltransferase 1